MASPDMFSCKSTLIVSRRSCVVGMSAANSFSVPNTLCGGASPVFFAREFALVSALINSDLTKLSGFPVRHQLTFSTIFSRCRALFCHFSRNFSMFSASLPVSATCASAIRSGLSSLGTWVTCLYLGNSPCGGVFGQLLTRLMGNAPASFFARSICKSASSRNCETFIARTHDAPIFSPPDVRDVTAFSKARTMFRTQKDITT
mmetsp:Transcript_3511/g.12982  ORF Transcript_3511/g.12982 Transcript_3511/m.12982 type:complete len:203 (-) Transcript_3511:311-919(-)